LSSSCPDPLSLTDALPILVTEPDGTYSAILPRRSATVETHPLFAHVAPSGIFAPIGADRRDDAAEFSIRRCLLREYAEELFGYRSEEHTSELQSLRHLVCC